jgi:restriction system protein
MSFLVLIVLIVVVGGSITIMNINNKAATFEECFKKHQETLLRKFRQSLYEDDYGNLRFDRWEHERNYFVANVLAREFSNGINDFNIDAMNEMIDKWIIDIYFKSQSTSTETESDLPEDITPTEYEIFCSKRLQNAGWQARTTKASGDQGIDIVASINGIKAVFQCKLYSKPVGNSAVQEISAGRGYEEAVIAAVISNNSFTKSARQLAQSLNVDLLHHDDIKDFTQKVIMVFEE